MVVVELKGGLGNQMFQYAAGLALATRLGIELYLDTSALRADCKRDFMLDGFGIEQNGVLARLQSAWWRRRLVQVDEPHFHYWRGYESLGDRVRLRGYWQSPRYFDGLWKTLRERFVPLCISDAARLMLEQIEAGEAVALHVRRGDLVNEPVTHAVHGACDAAYYQAALKLLRDRVPQCRLFVFSDDIDWVRRDLLSEIDMPYRLVSSQRDLDAVQEWWLMSRCHHHVLSNSTFGWWAAWLARHPGQQVVAPRQWFRDDSFDTRDLLPREWSRL